MGDPTLPPILIQLICLLAGGLSTAGETALKELASDPLIREEDDPLAALARSPRHALFACRAVTMAEVIISAMTGLLWLRLPGEWAQAHPTGGVVLIAALLGLIQLCLVSYFPRRLAAQVPERAGRLLLWYLRLGSVVLRPLSLLVNGLADLLIRPFGLDPHAADEGVSEEEIRLMVDMGEEKGAIESGERELIENVFEFNNSTAAEVMVHRTDVVMIWVEDTAEEILETIRTSGLSRFPVYEEDVDDIIGVLNTRDYLLNASSPEPKPLRELLRKAYFVPESVPADDLFRDMQSKKIHFAVVVDEYGGISGIITMEDLLEELVGNIYDEFDPQDEQEITPLGDDVWKIAGWAELEDVAEALGVEFPEEEDVETLGGLVFAHLDVIPEDGTHPVVEACGLHIEVEELIDRRVEWAKVSKLPREAEEPAGVQ